MTYNSPFSNNYQQMYYQQLQQLQQLQQQQNNSNNGIIWVQGQAGEKAFSVAPNAAVALWDSEAPVIYLKSADATGMPSVKILDYKVRDMTPQNVPILTENEFATKSDINILQDELNGLKMKIEGLTNARKTTPKKEVEKDE